MLAFRSVVSVLLRALGDFSLHSVLLKGLVLRLQPATWADRVTVGLVVRPRSCGSQSARAVRPPFPLAQAALGTGAGWRRAWRHSLSRLWVPHKSFHSASQAPSPRRRNRRAPRTSLIWPKTGSMVSLRLA